MSDHGPPVSTLKGGLRSFTVEDYPPCQPKDPCTADCIERGEDVEGTLDLAAEQARLLGVGA